MRRFVTLILIYAFILTACTSQQRHYKIGVSQCSDDIWREKQNSELRMGAYFHRNVELCFAAAYDSDERQVQQIDSLVATGIDLLIVAPNQVATISPAIDRAYDKGIPVIVFERKTNSQKYTAYMGADNYEMGRVMGDYIASRLHGRGKVLEIIGLKGSSPAIERHKGFTEALGKYPQIEIIDTLQGDWTEQSAYQAVKDFQGDLSNVDFVFGHNDRMAVGARKAMEERGLLSSAVSFCGIDGLAGDDGGIRLVRDSILDATYIYPTHGDQLLQMAVNILEEKPYTKEVKLMSALVTRENANVLLLQNEEIIRQSEYVDQLHLQADNYLQQLDTQHVIIIILDINQLQENTMLVRENIVDKQRLINNLMKSDKYPPELESRFNVLQQDISSLINHTNFSFERLEYLQDTVVGLINLEQNKIMKIFTLISLLLMPPTLVASFYGMNVELPLSGLSWAWIIIIAFMLLSLGVVLWAFKKRKML